VRAKDLIEALVGEDVDLPDLVAKSKTLKTGEREQLVQHDGVTYRLKRSEMPKPFGFPGLGRISHEYALSLPPPDYTPVATLLVWDSPKRKYLKCASIQVFPEFRRKGLASLLYLYAARDLGKPFRPSDDQSGHGKALWKGSLHHVFNKKGTLHNLVR